MLAERDVDWSNQGGEAPRGVLVCRASKGVFNQLKEAERSNQEWGDMARWESSEEDGDPLWCDSYRVAPATPGPESSVEVQ